MAAGSRRHGAWGIRHGAWGIRHGAWPWGIRHGTWAGGMGHGAWGRRQWRAVACSMQEHGSGVQRRRAHAVACSSVQGERGGVAGGARQWRAVACSDDGDDHITGGFIGLPH